jgi:hypothetical protein
MCSHYGKHNSAIEIIRSNRRDTNEIYGRLNISMGEFDPKFADLICANSREDSLEGIDFSIEGNGKVYGKVNGKNNGCVKVKLEKYQFSFGFPFKSIYYGRESTKKDSGESFQETANWIISLMGQNPTNARPLDATSSLVDIPMDLLPKFNFELELVAPIINPVKVVHNADNTQIYDDVEMRVACLNGVCSQGYECIDGYCVKLSDLKKVFDFATDKLANSAEDKAMDYFKDKVSETLLSLAEKSKLKVYTFLAREKVKDIFSFMGNVITEILECTYVATETEVYQNHIEKSMETAHQLAKFYDELNRSKTNQNLAREESVILNDIAKNKGQLALKINQLNEQLKWLKSHNELGEDFCYQCLANNQQMIINYYQSLLNR